MASSDLDLDLLRCFVSVVETGNFTLAAKRLRLTPNRGHAKNQAPRNILNQELFCRKNKGVELTSGGKVTLGYTHAKRPDRRI
jgi:DNA-binding transcriptional LysR family regulator